MADIVFRQPAEDLPHLVVVDPEGNSIRVSPIAILQCVKNPEDLEDATNNVRMYFLNTHHIDLSPDIAVMLMEEADRIYIARKKNCMGTLSSEDLDSTPTAPETETAKSS